MLNEVKRIASALERIADALAGPSVGAMLSGASIGGLPNQSAAQARAQAVAQAMDMRKAGQADAQMGWARGEEGLR